MFQFIRSTFLSPNSLSDDQLEPTFIDLKNKIIANYPATFNRWSDDISFRRLYERVDGIVGKILGRHERYFIEAEAKLDTWKVSQLFEELSANSWERKVYRAKSLNQLRMSGAMDTQALFYLCFFAYAGGVVRRLGPVESRPDAALEILDELIRSREHPDSIFLKGFIHKYGLFPDLPPQLSIAKPLLEQAADHGIGGAIIELRHFALHERLGRYQRPK